MPRFISALANAALLVSVAHGHQQLDVVVVGRYAWRDRIGDHHRPSRYTAALIESHRHLGGMSASGLGKTDIETREAIAGLFREFVARVLKYYTDKYGAGSENVKLSQDGYFYEPAVAESIFDAMVAEQTKIKVFRYHRLDEVIRAGKPTAKGSELSMADLTAPIRFRFF